MNELTISNKELIELIDNKDLGEVIQPLVKEIHLFDSFIAGTSYIEDKSIFDKIKAGDKVSLQRENNKFDENAILVLGKGKKKLGYVPEKDNVIFSRLMDAGKLLIGKVTVVEEKGSWYKIGIGIYLVDY